MSTFVASSETIVEGDNLSAVIDEVLQLMLCTLNRVNDLETVASQWAPVFAVKSSRYRVLFIYYIYSVLFFFLDIDYIYFSLLTFLGELLNKDHSVVKAFTNNILRHVSHHSFFFY